MIRRWYSWRKNSGKKQFDKTELIEISPYLVKTTAAVLLGALATQLDKIFVSKMLSVEQLGYYNLASTFAIKSSVVFMPISQALQAKAGELHSDSELYFKFNLKVVLLILSIILLMVVAIFFFLESVMSIWLNNKELVELTYPLVCYLLVGVAFNGISNVGYIYWLYNKQIGRIGLVNVINSILVMIMLPVMINKFQLQGAVSGWILSNFVLMTASLEWIKGSNKNIKVR